MLGNKNGFTLMEVLLVLSIIVIMLLLVIPLNILLLDKEREKQFIKEFSSDILLMQAYSRTSLLETRLKFYQDENKYKIHIGTGKPLVEKEIPEDWVFQIRGYNYEIQFSNSGAVNKLGNIVLKTKHHTYKFIFSLGKGRFRIEKD